jgi:hypothetical protein
MLSLIGEQAVYGIDGGFDSSDQLLPGIRKVTNNTVINVEK